MEGWGGEKTHRETFAGRTVVKIKVMELENRLQFGTRLAEGWDMTDIGERRKKQRGFPEFCHKEMEALWGVGGHLLRWQNGKLKLQLV